MGITIVGFAKLGSQRGKLRLEFLDRFRMTPCSSMS